MKPKYNFFLFFVLLVLFSSVCVSGSLFDEVDVSYSCDSADSDGTYLFDVANYKYNATFGSSVQFNGSDIINENCWLNGDGNSYMNFGDGSDVQMDTSHSNCVSFWLKHLQVGIATRPYTVDVSPERTLYVSSSVVYGRYGVDSAVYTKFGVMSAFNHYVWCVGNYPSYQLWENGTEVFNSTLSSSTGIGSMIWGNRNNSGSYDRGLKAYFDEIHFFDDYRLNDSEVQFIYDAERSGLSYKQGWVHDSPKSSNYNYTNNNILDQNKRGVWNYRNSSVIVINSTDFSMTFVSDFNSNWSAVVDNEYNYSKAISVNPEYKLSTTETTEHSITALNDSFGEGLHFVCLSGVSIVGIENESCDIKLNFSLVPPEIIPFNDTPSNVSGVVVNIIDDKQELIGLYVKMFVLLLWVVFLVLALSVKGKNNNPIQFLNIMNLCFGLASGTMWWGINFLVGFPVVFVSLGVFMGLIMKGK